ncbi:MAG TPA: methyltransferase domain-containing protein [Lichenihabitans sp.]|nr:methyltransferase domain-containing protein [Lichenihabitans sp.]
MTETLPNAGQIDYWNGEVGSRWARLQSDLDALFVNVTTALVKAADPRAGERVLDIGCGCGGSLMALSRWVGPTGRVLGLDISQPMLDVARDRIAAGAARNAAVLLGDAAVHPFEPGSADLVASRFGVMFFDRPAAAFANIRNALKPGGRLVFVCWRPYKDNPFFAAPHWAAKPHLPPDEAPKPDPDAPGPFALADPDRLRAILGDAGFREIVIEPVDVMLPLAGAGELDVATRLISQVGPVARALATADTAQRETATAAIRETLEDYDGPSGVSVPARIWVVTAAA